MYKSILDYNESVSRTFLCVVVWLASSSQFVLDLGLLEHQLAQLLGREDVLGLVADVFEPDVVVELALCSVDVVQKLVLPKVFMNCAQRVVIVFEGTLEASEILGPLEQVNRAEQAHLFPSVWQILVGGRDEVVGLQTSLLEDTVEDLSLLLGVSATVENAVAHEVGGIDLIWCLTLVLVLKSVTQQNLHELGIVLGELGPGWRGKDLAHGVNGDVAIQVGAATVSNRLSDVLIIVLDVDAIERKRQFKLFVGVLTVNGDSWQVLDSLDHCGTGSDLGGATSSRGVAASRRAVLLNNISISVV